MQCSTIRHNLTADLSPKHVIHRAMWALCPGVLLYIVDCRTAPHAPPVDILWFIRRRLEVRMDNPARTAAAQQQHIPSPGQPQWDVFISHRGPDTKGNVVEAIKRELLGRRVFVDKDDLLNGTKNWPQILQALTTARLVLVVITSQFQQSAWCLEELRIALLRPRNIRIVYWDAKRGHVDEVALAEAMKGFQKSSQLKLHHDPAQSSEAVAAAWRAALREAAEIVAKSHKPATECVTVKQQICLQHGMM